MGNCLNRGLNGLKDFADWGDPLRYEGASDFVGNCT